MPKWRVFQLFAWPKYISLSRILCCQCMGNIDWLSLGGILLVELCILLWKSFWLCFCQPEIINDDIQFVQSTIVEHIWVKGFKTLRWCRQRFCSHINLHQYKCFGLFTLSSFHYLLHSVAILWRHSLWLLSVYTLISLCLLWQLGKHGGFRQVAKMVPGDHTL